jgi:hypothetical protein
MIFVQDQLRGCEVTNSWIARWVLRDEARRSVLGSAIALRGQTAIDLA